MKNKYLIAIGTLLVVLLVGVTVLLLSEKQTNKELVQEFHLPSGRDAAAKGARPGK